MKLINIPANKFNEYTKHLPLVNFHQTANWASLKAHTNWHAHYLAFVDDKNDILAATLLLAKNIPLSKKQLFYAPRGFLIDFDNYDLLTKFHEEIIKYIKNNNGFELMIDPYLTYVHRDINGDIIDDGYKKDGVINTLENLGYKHFGFNLYNETLQPRWLFALSLKDKTHKELFKEFKYEKRRHINKKDFYAIKTRELNQDEIHLYKEVMDHTAKRRNFIDRPLKYYKNMYEAMHDEGMLRYFVAEMNFIEARNNIIKEIENSNNILNRLKMRSNQGPKTQNTIIEEEKRNASLHKSLNIVNEYASKVNDKTTILSGITLLNYGNEAVMLLAGNYEEFEIFQSSAILVNDLIKLSIKEGCERYNFYGITGDFSENNPLYGLYAYKREYGGEVIELIGQFEYIISKPTKFFYELGLKFYNLLKKIRH